MTIELGRTYRDMVSGYQGVAVCVTQWLTGCDRVGLQAPVDKDGKVPDPHYVDTLCAELQTDHPSVIRGMEETTDPFGGPRPAPKNKPSPR